MHLDQIYQKAISHLFIRPEYAGHLNTEKLKCGLLAKNAFAENSRAFHAALISAANGEKVSTLIAKLYGTKEGELLKELSAKEYSDDEQIECYYFYHIAMVDMFLESE